MWQRNILLGLILFIFICLTYVIRTSSLSTFFILPQRSLGVSNSSNGNKSIRHVAIILTRAASAKVLRHLFALARVGVETFVMCDERPPPYISNSIERLLHVDDASLAKYGLTRNRVWDRVFVWLYNQSSIEYVWLLEDDVTWLGPHYMRALFDKYANNRTDLLSRNIIYRNNDTRGWMWWPPNAVKLFPEQKCSGALNMLSRVSRQLILAHQHYTLQLLNETKQKQSKPIDGNVYYQEFFIPTVAHMFNLSMVIYDHSNMDVHIGALDEPAILRAINNGKQIFHAVKHDSLLLMNATQ